MRRLIVWIGLFWTMFFVGACHKENKEKKEARDKVVITNPVKVITPSSQEESMTSNRAIDIYVGDDNGGRIVVTIDSLPPKKVSLDCIDDTLSDFQTYIKELKASYPHKEVHIRAHKNADYQTFKKLIKELQDIKLTQYKLITQHNNNDDEGTDR